MKVVVLSLCELQQTRIIISGFGKPPFMFYLAEMALNKTQISINAFDTTILMIELAKNLMLR